MLPFELGFLTDQTFLVMASSPYRSYGMLMLDPGNCQIPSTI